MKTALLIDVNNIHATITKSNPEAKLDYKKYLDHLQSLGYDIVVQEAYGKSLDIVDSFKAALSELGFSIYYASGKPPFVHCDVDLTIRAIELAKTKIEAIILGTGKLSLVPCVSYLKRESDKQVFVSSFLIHNNLRRVADGSIPITDAMFLDGGLVH